MEREQATKFIYDLLRALVGKRAPTSSSPLVIAGDEDRRQDDPVSQQPLTSQHTAMLVRSVMNDRQAAEFEAHKECNFAIARRHRPLPRQLLRADGCVGMVLRVITTTIPSFDDLKLRR